MQSLYKNENLLFKDLHEFFFRKQHISEKRLPYYLLWVSRFHEFYSRRNIDVDSREAFTAYLQGLSKHHEDWQVQQARETVRLSSYFTGLQAVHSSGKG